MDAIIIPSKIIITIGEDGKGAGVVLQYKARVDGVIDAGFRTMDVRAGIDDGLLEKIIGGAIERVTAGEGTNLVKRRETETEVKERITKNLEAQSEKAEAVKSEK